MARMSRKKKEYEIESDDQTCQMGGYLRLSVEESSVYESDSIQNQRKILKEYIQKDPNMQLSKEYIDDGETGTNFNRPGFNQMIDDIRAGRINGVIVKDLSRFGRNFEETEEYLLKIFPHLKIRFVSVFDDYDSSYMNTDPILIAIKNLFNDYYAKDVSLKVSKTFDRLRKEGKYWGPRPPYGYLIDPEDHHHLIIDPETAYYVKTIFDMTEDGESYYMIIKWLHKNEIHPPMRRFYELGLFQNDRYKDLAKWYRSTIVNILRNPAYYGALPIAKSKKSLWENIPYHKIPQEDWECIENTHEAIISREQYQKVQKIIIQRSEEAKERQCRSEKTSKVVNLFSYKIYCGNCKRCMLRNYFRSRKGEREYYFICIDYSNSPGIKKCPHTYIREKVLKETIFEILKKHIAIICDTETLFKNYRQSVDADTKKGLYCQLEKVNRKINEKNMLRKEVYLDLKRGVLSEEDYTNMRKIYAKELGLLQEEKQKLEEQIGISCEKEVEKYSVFDEVKKFIEVTELTDEMVKVFVKRIEVFPQGNVEIKLHTEDIFSKLLMLTETFRKGEKDAI